jgi:hypothetical protein
MRKQLKTQPSALGEQQLGINKLAEHRQQLTKTAVLHVQTAARCQLTQTLVSTSVTAPQQGHGKMKLKTLDLSALNNTAHSTDTTRATSGA